MYIYVYIYIQQLWTAEETETTADRAMSGIVLRTRI